MFTPMNTPAIHQAMRLEKHPEDMAWLCFPDSDLPEGVNDLLRLCSSKEQFNEFSKNNDLDPEFLKTSLFNFIEKAILSEKNNDEKILGCDNFSSPQTQQFHYQLLTKLYHPDLSDRPNAEQYSEIINKAYERLKDKEQAQEVICFSENRRIPNNYQAAKKAEIQISHTKTVVAVFSVITIFTLVAMTGRFFDPANPELLSATPENPENKVVLNENASIEEQHQMIKVVSVKSDKTQSVEIKPEKTQTTSSKLQMLLKDLEVAYEVGDIEAIKPILASVPEIKDQSTKELNEKLATLFEITDERKMMLFDFDWKIVSGALEGKGKFLSRYRLVGEKEWLIREGKAIVSAKKENKKLKVTRLILENNTIE